MTDSDIPRRRRKLAAILMLDVVGFSRMMGRDEQGTTATIIEFHETVRAVVERHGGRVVSTAGDSVFGDFDSIVEALESAEEIQRALHAENVGKPADERIEARIGLHLGDVIVEERNVFGDGVNVAARLEQLAEPGGIMLSEAAYHLVRGRTSLPIEMIGPQSLKNIDEPIGVYRIRPAAFGAPDPVAPVAPVEADAPLQDNPGDRIREAVARITERLAERVNEVEDLDDRQLRRMAREAVRDDEKVVTLFRAGNLTVLALGVAGIIAWTSGWTSNAWYPFLGCYLVGLGFGSVLERLADRPGLSMFFSAVGIAIGTAFHGNGVTKAVFWILSAAIFGSALSRLAAGSRRRRSRSTR